MGCGSSKFDPSTFPENLEDRPIKIEVMFGTFPHRVIIRDQKWKSGCVIFGKREKLVPSVVRCR